LIISALLEIIPVCEFENGNIEGCLNKFRIPGKIFHLSNPHTAPILDCLMTIFAQIQRNCALGGTILKLSHWLKSL
jgi:hypothetical protein